MAITRTPLHYDAATQRWIPGTETTVSYEGRVLRVYQRDYRAMSDVWTDATFASVITADGTVEEILVNANFECDMGGGAAEIDATPEVLAQVEALREAEALAAKKAAEDQEARRIAVGRRVRVVRGRKVPVGTEGECSWYGQTKYGARVGIRDLQGQVTFTAASNVEVVTIPV